MAYAACLLGATFTYARVVAQHGLFWKYGGAPAVSAALWTSLTVLDPLTVIFLLVRPNGGVIATGVIIVTDVFHNLWITARYARPHHFLVAAATDPFVVSQIVFMLLVAATIPVAWTRAK